MAAKKTGDLIPLCHPLGLEAVSIEFHPGDEAMRVVATASLSVALLTLYDMGKALDKGMQIEGIRLVAKTGGKSGDWHAKD